MSEQQNIRPLTVKEQRSALTAVSQARELQRDLAKKYGTMTPEGWELLAESRDERTGNLVRAVES
jgi:hypothetical protein